MDPYRLLNVSRQASPDDIERAYRRLARRVHPGVNPGDRAAEEAYRQIHHAYELLRDADRRREYDDFGAAGAPRAATVETTIEFQGFDFRAPAEGPLAATFSELFSDVFQQAARRATTPGPEPVADVALGLSFEDAMRGGTFPLPLVRRARCAACAGAGQAAQPPMRCPDCAGEGTRRWARGHMVFTKVCEGCAGAGLRVHEACRVCGGGGVSLQTEVTLIPIPAGTEDGARLVVPGAGAGSESCAVRVEVASHPFFRRRGADLEITLPVAVHEAALGARVDVPTLEGPVRLRIPPGTPSGQRLRLRGRGVPSSRGEAPGDLIVDIQVVLPPVRDERSKELLREFGRLNDVDVRRHLFER